MFPFNDVNILAMFAAAILNMILGMTWYSPAVFGDPWMLLTGVDPSKTSKEDMKKAFATGFFGNLMSCYFIGALLAFNGVVYNGEGMLWAALVWFGFIVSSELQGVAWEQRSPKLMAINVGYTLISIVLTVLVYVNWPW